MEQGLGKLLFYRLDFFDRETGPEQADSAGNVEAHASRGDDASNIGVERSDAASTWVWNP